MRYVAPRLGFSCGCAEALCLGTAHAIRNTVSREPGRVVFGGGDPRLTTPDEITKERAQTRFRDAPFTSLGDLADAVVAAGVHEVRGALLVDDHIHDDTVRFLPVWKPIYAQEGDIVVIACDPSSSSVAAVWLM